MLTDSLKSIHQGLELAVAFIGGLLMIGIYCAGVMKVGVGVRALFLADGSAIGLADILKGIEYFFLAPLVLLACVSSVLSVRGFFGLLDGQRNPRKSDEPLASVNPYEGIVLAVKEATASLVVAILLTDLVGKALSDSNRSWLALSGECATVLLGLGYLWMLVRSSRHDSRI